MRFQNPFTEDNFVYSKIDVCAVATAAAIVVVLLVNKNEKIYIYSCTFMTARVNHNFVLFYMEQAPPKNQHIYKKRKVLIYSFLAT